jgi:hypothetical protein
VLTIPPKQLAIPAAVTGISTCSIA